MKKENQQHSNDKNQSLSKTKAGKIEKSFRTEITKESGRYLSHELEKYKNLSIHVVKR